MSKLNDQNSKVSESVDNSLLIDEFEICELEDRLELAGRCNGRCDAPAEVSE